MAYPPTQGPGPLVLSGAPLAGLHTWFWFLHNGLFPGARPLVWFSRPVYHLGPSVYTVISHTT